MPLPVTKHGNSVSVLQFWSVSSQTVATAFFRLQIYCASVDETRDMCVVDNIFFFFPCAIRRKFDDGPFVSFKRCQWPCFALKNRSRLLVSHNTYVIQYELCIILFYASITVLTFYFRYAYTIAVYYLFVFYVLTC